MSSKVFLLLLFVIKFILQESGNNFILFLLNYLQQIYNYDNYCKLYKEEVSLHLGRYRHNLHDHTFGVVHFRKMFVSTFE